MLELLIAGVVVFGAGFVEGLTGFGFGLVCMGLLPLLREVAFVVPFVAVFSITVSGLLLVQLRRAFDLRRVAPMLLGTAFGLPLGITFLKHADASLVRGALGAVLVTYAAWGLRRPQVRARPLAATWGVAAGLAGGVLGGAFNTSGPPVVAYTGAQAWGKDGIKASLQGYFVVTGVGALTGFALSGLVTRETLTWNAWLLPALVAGVYAGAHVYARIDLETFRRLLLLGLGLMGAGYLGALAMA